MRRGQAKCPAHVTVLRARNRSLRVRLVMLQSAASRHLGRLAPKGKGSSECAAAPPDAWLLLTAVIIVDINSVQGRCGVHSALLTHRVFFEGDGVDTEQRECCR